MAKSDVATATEQATHRAGSVIMVDRKTLAGTARPLANATDTILLNKQSVVISGR